MLSTSGMRRGSNSFVIIICAVVIVVLAALSGFFFWQYTQLKNNPEAAAQETTKRLVEKVSKLYAVPADEQPTVAEIKDKEKLKDQAFFNNAQNGDHLLIYTKAKTALLYREKDNKLINVGPVAIDSNQQAQAQQVSVKVINGTNKNGRATTVADDIKAKLGTAVLVDAAYGDAKNKNITKTTVVDVKGDKSAQAKQIADAIGGQVANLPAGEAKPEADILVIAGP